MSGGEKKTPRAAVVREFETPAGLPAVLVDCRDSGVFSVEKTFDCGQSFRFSPVGGDPRVVCGSVRIGEGEDARITVDGTREEEGFLTLAGCTAEEFGSRWRSYLDLDADYGAGEKRILDALPEGASRDAMADALRAGRGIRLLRQDPWEMLVTSILTQNNNIPRIRGIAARLCAASGGRFPEPADILRIGTEGLYALGCGFRAKYLTDAAERTADGRADPRKIAAMGTEDARAVLEQIRGVGPKVASCALLFGYHRTEAFPVDVWMKRALAEIFPDGVDPALFGEWAGYAQQCMFWAEREKGRRSWQ